jgi:hypothetical protein
MAVRDVARAGQLNASRQHRPVAGGTGPALRSPPSGHRPVCCAYRVDHPPCAAVDDAAALTMAVLDGKVLKGRAG